jgi:hypothetical protein
VFHKNKNKMKKRIKVLMLAVWLLVPLAGTQAQAPQPFREAPAHPTIDGEPLRAPGEKMLKGPSDPLPNDDEGEGGPVGMPVRDGLWLLPLPVVAYGLYRRKKRRDRLHRHKTP